MTVNVNTSYGRFPLVQSLNIFVLVSGNPQQNTSTFGGNGKSGSNEQEQCIVWIPLQCEVPVAKRANSYSAAMVMTCKTGESSNNGASPKVDTHFRTRLNLRQRANVIILVFCIIILPESSLLPYFVTFLFSFIKSAFKIEYCFVG